MTFTIDQIKLSMDNIKAGYTMEKQRWDFFYPWIYFFVRPVSFWLAWFLIPLGISAHQATLISLLIGLTSCVFFTFGYELGFYVGAFLLILFNIMDCVDGNIARAKKTTGPIGRYFDGLAGNIHIVVYVFIGLGLYSTPDESLAHVGFKFLSSQSTGMSFFCTGVLTTIAIMLSMQVRENFHSTLGEQWEEHKNTSGKKEFTHVGKWYYYVYYNVTDLQAHEFVLLIAVVTHVVGFFLILSALISLFNLAFLIFLYSKRIRKIAVG